MKNVIKRLEPILEKRKITKCDKLFIEKECETFIQTHTDMVEVDKMLVIYLLLLCKNCYNIDDNRGFCLALYYRIGIYQYYHNNGVITLKYVDEINTFNFIINSFLYIKDFDIQINKYIHNLIPKFKDNEIITEFIIKCKEE